MKDLIKFCMTKHEEEIKALAKSPLGGQRFQMFIRRWEMNNEPLPVEMKDKCVTWTLHNVVNLTWYSRPIDPRWPVQSRALDAEEEDYFNGEDDDDFIPSISHHWPRTNGPSPLQHGNNNNLKRKRRMAVAGPLASRGIRPQNNQNHAPQMRTLGPLVDYDDEEEAGGASPDGKDKDKDKDKEDAPPSSPKLSHRQVGSGSPNGLAPKRLGSEEEEDDDDDERDNMLEALVNSRPQSPAPGLMASLDELGPMRPGEKRRRNEEDEDEELLERLSRSAKKPDLGDGKAKEASAVRVKPNEEPKKLKLKLISSKAASIASTSPSPVPSEPGAKDGDTG